MKSPDFKRGQNVYMHLQPDKPMIIRDARYNEGAVCWEYQTERQDGRVWWYREHFLYPFKIENGSLRQWIKAVA